MSPSTRSLILVLLTSHLSFFALLVGCHEESSHHEDPHGCNNKYSRDCNVKEDLTDEAMFERGHMKPFGSHRPPDEIVQELPYMISPEDFYMNFVVKHKPVVLKGAAKHWPAYTKWTDDYLNTTYGDTDLHMETKDDDKWHIPADMKLRDFLGNYNHSNRYLVDELIPDMRKDVILPLCLRCEEMSSYFFVSYFWMSMGGTSSSIHIDTDENLLCVIHGHKLVHMVSPIYSKYLYTDESRVLGVSDINSQAVDMEKYPDFVKVRYVSAFVEEGDMVYIPQMWWHQVVSRPERQQAVALWWKSKPWWKEQGRNAPPLQPDRFNNGLREHEFSYANILAQYEQWVQNVSARTPKIDCKDQHVLMSDYRFETDKEKDAPRTLGDGGDLEEEAGWSIDEINDAERLQNLRGCHFDRANEKSPCHYSVCAEDDEDTRCIRYVLDYCQRYEDRGCVIQLPQLMNKLDASVYKEVQQMKSEFAQS